MDLGKAIRRWFEWNIKEGFKILPMSAFKKAFIGGTCSFVPFLLSLIGGTMGSFGSIFRLAEYVGYIFSIGFPIVLAASLLFSSEQSRENFIESALEEKQLRFAPLFTAYLLFTCMMMVWAVFFGFSIRFAFSVSAEGGLYLPHLITAVLPITMLLCPITALFALAMDGWKSSIAVGVALFLGIAVATGQPHFPVSYPEVALFGPAHMLLALLFIMAIGFGSPASASWYVGFEFAPINLLLPMVVFFVISLISYTVASRSLLSNLQRWVAFSGEWETKMDSISGLDGPESIATPSKLQENYHFRRKMVTAFVVVCVILFPLTSAGYTTVRNQEWRTVVYESPAGGESVEIGEWLIGSFQGIEGERHTSLYVTCEGELHGGAQDAAYVRYNFRHRQMTLSEIQQMNETEMEESFGRSWGRTPVYGTRFDTGGSGPISDVEYVWIFRFLDVGGRTEGRITVSLRIVIQARPF
ncbi:MAG: hypothetical protein R6V83_06240 [Candidatus Thorarchaeota archaeon]